MSQLYTPLAEFSALPKLAGSMSEHQLEDSQQVKAIHCKSKSQANQIL